MTTPASASSFAALDLPWREAFTEAWEARLNGSLPIGCVIVDAEGRIVGRGRNRLAETRGVDGHVAGHDLAHAEINGLLSLPAMTREDAWTCTLYTTVEPCPQCAGALVMSSVRGLSYAAADPWAGCAHLLTDDPYMRRKAVRVTRASREVRDVCGALALTSHFRSPTPGASAFDEVFEREEPHVFRAALTLWREGTVIRLAERRASPAEVYEVVRAAFVSRAS